MSRIVPNLACFGVIVRNGAVKVNFDLSYGFFLSFSQMLSLRDEKHNARDILSYFIDQSPKIHENGFYSSLLILTL